MAVVEVLVVALEQVEVADYQSTYRTAPGSETQTEALGSLATLLLPGESVPWHYALPSRPQVTRPRGSEEEPRWTDACSTTARGNASWTALEPWTTPHYPKAKRSPSWSGAREPSPRALAGGKIKDLLPLYLWPPLWSLV